MKKIILMLIILMLTSITLADEIGTPIGYNEETGDYVFYLSPGWNLVPLGLSGLKEAVVSGTSEAATCTNEMLSENIKATYIYNPLTKSYVNTFGFSPPTYNQTFNFTENKLISLTPTLTGQWIYVNQNASTCKLGFGIQKKSELEGLKDYKLKIGWNFVTISPLMIGNTYKELFKNCNITAANSWNTAEQKWTASSSTQFGQMLSEELSPIINEDGLVGLVFVIKVSNDCTLNYGSNTTGPPELPN